MNTFKVISISNSGIQRDLEQEVLFITAKNARQALVRAITLERALVYVGTSGSEAKGLRLCKPGDVGFEVRESKINRIELAVTNSEAAEIINEEITKMHQIEDGVNLYWDSCRQIN